MNDYPTQNIFVMTDDKVDEYVKQGMENDRQLKEALDKGYVRGLDDLLADHVDYIDFISDVNRIFDRPGKYPDFDVRYDMTFDFYRTMKERNPEFDDVQCDMNASFILGAVLADTKQSATRLLERGMRRTDIMPACFAYEYVSTWQLERRGSGAFIHKVSYDTIKDVTEAKEILFGERSAEVAIDRIYGDVLNTLENKYKNMEQTEQVSIKEDFQMALYDGIAKYREMEGFAPDTRVSEGAIDKAKDGHAKAEKPATKEQNEKKHSDIDR